MDARLQQYEDRMKKAYEYLESDYNAIRAGRANPHVLDKLRVDYYGTPTPIQQVGNITVPEARIIQIAPWEKSLIKAIEKAIMASDVGITPSNDGSVIRLVFPELTEERRKDLAKEVRKKAEDGKVAVRNIRRDGNDALKKMGKTEVSEDEIKLLEDQLQKLTDKYIKDMDALMEKNSGKHLTGKESEAKQNEPAVSGAADGESQSDQTVHQEEYAKGSPADQPGEPEQAKMPVDSGGRMQGKADGWQISVQEE